MANRVKNCGNAGKFETIPEWLDAVMPEFKKFARDLHEIIIKTQPKFEQAIKWGRPCYTKHGQVRCYIALQSNYLQLGFFNGASITNPDGIIEGTGKRLRHIKVKSLTPELKARFAVAIGESYELPPEASGD